MSSVTDISDKLRYQINEQFKQVRIRVFGVNNERLDFFMDSFYKLSPSQQTGLLAGIGVSIAALAVVAAVVFFSQVNRLKTDLGNSFAAMHELKTLYRNYEIEKGKFDKLVKDVDSKTRSLRMKPFFEKQSQAIGLTVDNLREQNVPLAADNPLNKSVQEVVVEMRAQKVSIPRLLNFLVEVEKADKFLRIRDLEIRGRYGTRLYFDSEIKVRGYKVL